MKIKNSKTKLVGAIAAAFVLFSSTSFAANTLTSGVKITRIDATAASGDIRVQTDPRPNVAGLSCPSNFWLVLKADGPNYKQLVASLLTAKAADFTVSVGADDDSGNASQFCDFSRLVVD